MKRDGVYDRRIGPEGDDMVDIEPDADAFADGVVMVRWYERENFRAARQAQRVQELGAAKGAVQDLRLRRALIVVDDVVRA